MEDEINFLKDHVSFNIKNLLNECLEYINEKRKKIILINRKILLSDLNQNMIFNSLSCMALELNSHQQNKFDLNIFKFSPTEIVPPVVSPRIVQQVSMLIEYFMLNYDVFANALVSLNDNKNKKLKNIKEYCVNAAIPMLFGYFSTDEYNASAVGFYLKLIELAAPSEAVFSFLIPFFISSSCFPYFESVISPFLSRFILEKQFSNKKETDQIVELYIDYIESLLINFSQIFPTYQSRCLKIMRYKWGNESTLLFFIGKVLQIFLDKFLRFHSLIELKPHSDKIVKGLLKKFITTKNGEKILDSLTNLTIEFQIPSLFLNFGDKFKMFFTSFFDIQCLSVLFSNFKTLPNSLQSIPFKSTDPFSYFWVRVFPKNLKYWDSNNNDFLIFDNQINLNSTVNKNKYNIEKNDTYDNIYSGVKLEAVKCNMDVIEYIQMFSNFNSYLSSHSSSDLSSKTIRTISFNPSLNITTFLKLCKFVNFSQDINNYLSFRALQHFSKKAKHFENLMTYLMFRKQVKDWKKVVYEQLHVFCMNYALQNISDEHEFRIKLVFSHVPHLFQSKVILKCQYIAVIEKCLANILKERTYEFNIIRKEWAFFLSQKKESLDILSIVFLHKSSNTLFWDCIKKLNLLEKENLVSSYQILQITIGHLVELQNAEKPKFSVFDTILLLSEIPNFLKLFLTISIFAIGSDTFISFCSEYEIRNWTIFEKAILKLVMQNQSLKEHFFTLQNYLIDIKIRNE